MYIPIKRDTHMKRDRESVWEKLPTATNSPFDLYVGTFAVQFVTHRGFQLFDFP